MARACQPHGAGAATAHAYCGIEGERRTKDDRKAQHLEGRPYYVKFRGEEKGDGIESVSELTEHAKQCAAAHAAQVRQAERESAFDRLVRIGN